MRTRVIFALGSAASARRGRNRAAAGAAVRDLRKALRFIDWSWVTIVHPLVAGLTSQPDQRVQQHGLEALIEPCLREVAKRGVEDAALAIVAAPGQDRKSVV